MKKQLLTLLLALMALATHAATGDTFEVGYFAFKETTNGNVTCTGVSSTFPSTVTSLTIPGYVKNPNDSKYYKVRLIADYAFQNLIQLQTVKINYGVVEIGVGAFRGCAALAEVRLPGSVQSIYSKVFKQAPISKVYCAAEAMTDIEFGIAGTAFDDMAASATGTRTWYEPTEDAVTAAQARERITNNFTVSLDHAAADVTKISNKTVLYCNITAAPADIQSSTSRGTCKVVGFKTNSEISPGVTYVTQNRSYNITEIGAKACVGYDNVKAVYLAAVTTLVTIGDNAFKECKNLTAVALPNGLKTLSDGCFSNCDSLKAIEIPSSVTSIAHTTFVDDCPSLTAINVDGNNNTYSSIDGVLYDKAKTTLLRCPEGYAGQKDNMHNVGRVGGNFYLPYSCTKIEIYAFQNNNGLAGFYATRLKTIKSWAFLGCTKLREVQLPSSITDIGALAFKDCARLTTIIVNRKTPITIDKSSVFYGCDINYLSVPYGTEDAYKAAGWTGFASYTNGAYDYAILPTVNEKSASSANVGFMGFTLTSTDPEVIDDEQFDGRMQVSILSYGTPPDAELNIDVEIPRSCEIAGKKFAVTSIGSEAVQYANYYRTSNIINAALVDTVCDYAFYSIKKHPLIEVELPYVSYIGRSAFQEAGYATPIYSNRLRTIGQKAFYLSGGSKDRLTYPDLVKRLKKAILPYGVEVIGDSAFAESNITTLLIPSSVTRLGQHFITGATIEALYINDAAWARSDFPFDFTGVSDECIVFTPYSAVSAFRAHDKWKQFTRIGAGAYDIYDANTKNPYTVVDPEQSTVKLVARDFGNSASKMDLTQQPVTDENYGGNYTLTELDAGCLEDAIVDTLMLPSTVTRIGDKAMKNIMDLKVLQCDATTPPALGVEVWQGIDQQKVKLIVPAEAEALYRAADQWKGFFTAGTRGDVNGDGKVDVADVNQLINIMLGKSPYTTVADVNGDGKVDVADVNQLINIMLGKS